MPEYLVDANLPYYFSLWKKGEPQGAQGTQRGYGK